MTREIHLTGLKAFGRHGVFDFEKAEGQEFSVDVRLTGDFSRAAQTDRLEDTVDYGAVADLAAGIVSSERYDLIEALAARIAGAIAETITVPCTVEVTVHKPSAPIQHDFADVTVRAAAQSGPEQPSGASSEGDRVCAVLSLGANQDDPRAQLEAALTAIDRLPRVSVQQRSGLYSTAPVGGVEQDDFVNCAAVVEAECSPRELLASLQGIEVAQGRVRDVRWGPRTLDIDIIRIAPCGADIDDPREQTVSADPVLTLPHPRAGERAFVLVPWAEIRPEARIELDGEIISADAAAERVQAGDPDQTVRRLS